MRPTVIDWDGAHVPPEMKNLPPGRYVVEPIEPDPGLTPEEERGIEEALANLDAGHGIPLADVVKAIRGGTSRM